MIFMKKPSFVKPEYSSCPFCEKEKNPDYKDYQYLSKFLSDRARIISLVRTGVCARHQRSLGREIKRARYLGLLPFVEKVD